MHAESDSILPLPACGSPVGADEKSSLNWMSAACRSRDSFPTLPPPLVRAFSDRSRLGYLLTPPFGTGAS